LKLAGFSSDDRLMPAASRAAGNFWIGPLIYGLLLPFTVIAVGFSGWYVVTGETPNAIAARLLQGPRISLPMPARPGPEKPQEALMRPPEAPTPTLTPAPAAPPPPAEEKVEEKPAPAPAPAPEAEKPAPPPPPPPAASTYVPPPPPPAMAEPATPPGGESLAPPSFAQLPALKEAGRPLPPAPVPDLLRASANGPLPVTANGRAPWKVYARPVTVAQSKPGAKIAVVVTDLGLSRDATTAAIAKLPAEVSLSFSPYASTLDQWIKKARDSGHETLMDLPLEPPNFPQHDPGALAVLQSHSPGEALGRMDEVLGKATSYVGVAASLRSPVTATDSWTLMLQELRERGLLLLGDGLVGVDDKSMPAAASITLVADETPFRTAIDARLARALATALRDGSAVVTLSARPVSFERLLAFLASLPEKNAMLVPVSALVRPEP
jgi:polysaccharide deacetylase 2 family uncharacterized protein YibQ